MNKTEELRENLYSKINNLKYFIESYSGKEIYIAEYNKNSTSYILKSIDFKDKTCSIEIRKAEGKIVETILFDNNKVFIIYNSGETYFIPIDGKGLLKVGHCDFVFFNELNFCFIEMKLNATSLDERKIEDNRKKAVKQLKNTIDYFDKTLSNNYSGLSLEAYIATPDSYPRKNTAFQDIEVKFLEDTGIKLLESREIRYKNGSDI